MRNQMTFTRMTDAMFQLPFRMMEMPFLMSAAVMDAMMADMNSWGGSSWLDREGSWREEGGTSRRGNRGSSSEYTERRETEHQTVRRAPVRRGPTRVKAA